MRESAAAQFPLTLDAKWPARSGACVWHSACCSLCTVSIPLTDLCTLANRIWCCTLCATLGVQYFGCSRWLPCLQQELVQLLAFDYRSLECHVEGVYIHGVRSTALYAQHNSKTSSMGSVCYPLKFENGKVYQYTYTTSTLFSEVNTENKLGATQKDVGVQLSVNFDLTALLTSDDAQFLKLQLTSAKFSSVARPTEERDLPSLLKYPAFFEMTGDTIEKVFLVDADPVFSTNIKKGIMALFQVKEGAGERTEVDVCGECKVSYAVPSPGTVSKTKNSCQNLEIAGQFTSPNKVLGLTVWNKATVHYELKDGVVHTATGTTRLVSYLNLRTNTGRSLVMSLLPSDDEVQQCTESSCQSPKQLVGKLHDDLMKEKLATLDSAKAFVKMLRSFRNSGKATLAEVLSSPDSYYIVQQLIDIATAAQTRPAQEALMDLVSFEDDYALEYPERYLFAAAYSTHPSESLIRDLITVLGKKLPSETLKESLLLGLASIINTYCQVKVQCQQPIVKEVQTLLVTGLENCGEQTCRQMYLRALGNAGLPDTIAVILPHTETPNAAMLSCTAIEALRRMHKQFIDDSVKQAMLRILHQNQVQYDSSVRVAALMMILRNQPSPQVLKDILLAGLDQTNFEFSTYVVNSVRDAAVTDASVRQSLSAVLQDPFFNNYHVLSQKGKSSIFTNFLAKTTDINATYTMYIENSNAGIMKKSGMDVNLLGKLLNQPFMKFGIYAEGLESLVGDEEEGEQNDDAAPVEPTAGMSFNLMDVLLRQIEFFRGSAGLMSAVWNAPSELTSALQGNLLLQDHFQRVHLSNGLVVEVEVLGVLSMDLSGYASISLWNRNCEALIKNSGALYIEGTMRLDSSLLKSGLVFSGEGQSAIDFTVDADFYEMPLKLCMQMLRPAFTFKQSVVKYERLKGLKRLRRRRSKSSKITAESYFLNKANTEECRVMKKEDEE
ncbi:hypothetical protein BaRGS_00010247 [Batillaria attramentaria]|uniref:Vitellogenin domain-containing protein n=1 Tax=Batillaria attramentaria TaxID=370345 RepID=A0ABD0LGF9_9CAEN